MRKKTDKVQKTVWLSKLSWLYVNNQAGQETRRLGRRVSESTVIDRIIQDEATNGKRETEKTS